MERKLFYLLELLLGILFIQLFYLKQRTVEFSGDISSPDKIEWILCCGFFLSLFLMQALFFHISKQKLRQELEIKNRLLEEQERYYTLLLKKEEDTKKFRHDMNQQFLCLKELLCQQDYHRGISYLEECLEKKERMNYVIQTGNIILDILINDLVHTYPVDVHWSGVFPEWISMKDTDLCILFSNLFLNAAEAAVQTSFSVIHIHVRFVQEHLQVQIKNPVVMKRTIQNQRIQTTKKEKFLHGIGMSNANDIVKKYRGSIRYEYKEKTFLTTITFFSLDYYNQIS